MAGLPKPVDYEDDKEVDEKQQKQIKRERNRVRAIDELIATEQTYCDRLRLLVELYCKPLKTKKLIKPKHLNTLFPEIETIIHLNSNLLTSLENNKSSDKIGEAMISFVPYFKMYQNYVNNHENASKLLTDLIQSNSSFSSFLTEQQNDSKARGQSLQSFLILPIQRVPRYELCLKEIIKLTPPDNADLDNLKLCYDKVCNVNKSINDRMHEFASREKVRSVERRFQVGSNVSLVAPARTYVREGYFKKVSRKKDIKYFFVLFSDLLIYCSEVSGTKKLKLHQRLDFDLYFKIKKVDNNRKYGNKCFEIYSTSKSFLCVHENNSERESWANAIQQCLDKMRANRKLEDSKKLDGRILDVSPIWIPDDFSDRCMIPSCMKKFTFTRRRHHCRYCGRIICSACSKNQLPHYVNKQEIVRVGSLCYAKYKMHFPDFDLKVNRKNKSSYSISSTPKGADYEIEWDNDSDEDEYDSDNDANHHKRIMTAPSTLSSSPPTAITIQQLRKGSQTRISAYKPAIKPKAKSYDESNVTPNETVKEDNNHNSNVSNGSSNRYQAMINTMQSKLNKERKLNLELQGQINDLRAENQRLRKSKVDLMTWSNSEIAKYKKEIQHLKQQSSGSNQEGTSAY